MSEDAIDEKCEEEMEKRKLNEQKCFIVIAHQDGVDGGVDGGGILG